MEKRLKDKVPRVSVIMPTYNRGHILKQAVMSVKNQSYSDFELIIIDDGSTDNTEEIIGEISDGDIVYLKSAYNRGANYARNIGLKKARGTYITFLDTDNVWNENFLYNRVKAIEDAGVDFVFGRVKVCDKENYRIEPREPVDSLQEQEVLLKTMAFWNVIDTNTICMNRNCYKDLGGFDENLKRCQDWEYFYRIISSEKYTYKFIDNILVEGTIQKDSISNTIRYWPGRLYIFNKYITVYRNKGYLAEVLFFLYHQLAESEEYDDSIRIFFEYTSEDEKQRLLRDIYREKKQNEELAQSLLDKNNLIMEIQSKWLELEYKGIHIEERLYMMDMPHIAIYGYGVLGQQLYRRLVNKGINIECLIDKNPSVFRKNSISARKICVLDELKSLKLDLIIVTAVYYFKEISEELQTLTTANIISLETLIEEEYDENKIFDNDWK